MQQEVVERRSAALDLLEATRVLESTRTVAALVGAAVAGIAQLRRRARPRPPTVVSVRLVRAGSTAVLTRTGPLTPYVIETLADDVRGIAPGARLDVALAGESNDDDLALVRRQLAALGRRGVSVSVVRAHRHPVM